jgi:SAM-dependent methyltransferase
MHTTLTDMGDETAFKAAMRAQWNTAAPGWNAHTASIGEWLSLPTEAMCRMAGVAAGSRVLDVAAGAGGQTLVIARLVGPRGQVLATDLSPAILALARQNAVAAGFANVETQVADGERLDVAEASFDAAVCRLGLMFFADALQGLREMHRALRPGGWACTLVFARPETNPCLTILMSTALRHAALPARDPCQAGGLMSLGQPGHVDRLFRAAGFHDVATTALDAVLRLPSVDDYLAFVRSSASPILDILARLPPTAAEAAWAEIRDRLDVFTTPQGWAGPNELLLTAGRRSQRTT